MILLIVFVSGILKRTIHLEGQYSGLSKDHAIQVYWKVKTFNQTYLHISPYHNRPVILTPVYREPAYLCNV